MGTKLSCSFRNRQNEKYRQTLNRRRRQKDGTEDDLNVLNLSFAYFTPTGKAIDAAIKSYFEETGKFIRDSETLKSELLKQNVDLNLIKDRWNREYQVDFGVLGRNYVIEIRSVGPDGLNNKRMSYNGDDFVVWRNEIDYFGKIEAKINKALGQTVNSGKRQFPKSEEEFIELLKANDIDFSQIKDGYDGPVYLNYGRQYRYTDKTTVVNEKQQIIPVTEELAVFTIKSKGANRISGEYGTSDDFNLGVFSTVLSTQSKDTKFEKIDVRNISYSGTSGAIRGRVLDQAEQLFRVQMLQQQAILGITLRIHEQLTAMVRF